MLTLSRIADDSTRGGDAEGEEHLGIDDESDSGDDEGSESAEEGLEGGADDGAAELNREWHRAGEAISYWEEMYGGMPAYTPGRVAGTITAACPSAGRSAASAQRPPQRPPGAWEPPGAWAAGPRRPRPDGPPGRWSAGTGHARLTGHGAAGHAGSAQGICKWYAAGFCRNQTQDFCCHNGLHDAEAALKAEADWARPGHEAAAALPRGWRSPVLLLLDLEGAGNQEATDGANEIIEVPVLAMCPSTGQELGRFHRFVRPGFWDREAASMRSRHPPRCFNESSSAVSFPQVIFDLLKWIRKLLHVPPGEELKSDRFLFITCGNWDVKTAIPRQWRLTPGAVPFGVLKLLFSRWSNLKEVFKAHYRLPTATAPTGMRGMLKMLRIPLLGQHHLGMDDVSNLSEIMKRLIGEGCHIGPTGVARWAGGPPGNGVEAPRRARSPMGKGAGRGGRGGGGYFERGQQGYQGMRGRGARLPRWAV